MMCRKFNLKTIFKIEYILILIAVFNFSATQFFRKKALQNFTFMDNSFTAVRLQYIDFLKGFTIDEEIITFFEKSCRVYAYFDEYVQNSIIVISTILREYHISDSNRENLRNLLTATTTELQIEIHKKQKILLQGLDIIINFTFFFIVLAAFVFIKKNIRKSKRPEIQADDKVFDKEFSIKTFLMTSIAIIIAADLNCSGSLLIRKLTYPLYLDSILTIGITAAFGLIPGIICAVMSHSILYLLDCANLPFILCHILTAFFAWRTFRRKAGKNYQLNRQLPLEIFLWAGLWSGISNAITGNIISMSMFPAETTLKNLDNITYAIFTSTENLNLAIWISGLLSNLTDKMISALLSIIFYKLICFFRKKQCS